MGSTKEKGRISMFYINCNVKYLWSIYNAAQIYKQNIMKILTDATSLSVDILEMVTGALWKYPAGIHAYIIWCLLSLQRAKT